MLFSPVKKHNAHVFVTSSYVVAYCVSAVDKSTC